MTCTLPKPHNTQQFPRHPPRLPPRHTIQTLRNHQILKRAEIRKQMMILIHKPDPSAPRQCPVALRQPRDIPPVQKYSPAVTPIQQTRDMQQSALPAPRCADQRRHLAGAQTEINARQDTHLHTPLTKTPLHTPQLKTKLSHSAKSQPDPDPPPAARATPAPEYSPATPAQPQIELQACRARRAAASDNTPPD